MSEPIGRPSLYSQELADEICSQLSGGKSLRSVCLQESMPSARTVFSWLRDKPDFLQQYEKSKEESSDALADEMIDIADDQEEDAQSRRVRIDTRKWIASKLKPKKYGDKLDAKIEHSGGVTLTIGAVDPNL